MELSADRTALITGGASGIGLGIARALAARGVRLVLTDVNAEALAIAAQALSDTGAEVLPLTLDVRDEAAWTTAAEAAWAWSGGVQILCNAAGVVFVGAAADEPVKIWRLTQAVNLDGPYLGVHTLLPRMLASGDEGRIVNIASLAALWGEGKLASYSASKFGLLGLSEALQLELSRTRIGVTVVFPGPTRTNLGASGRRLAASEGLMEAGPQGQGGGRGMDPDALGRRVVKSIERDEVYVITHPGWRPLLDVRFDALRKAFAESADPDYAEAEGAVDKMAHRLGAALAGGPRPAG
jgi:NAD(P)-dependent dehydrogenase (short-subunit alcohol dehydrogenase family)